MHNRHLFPVALITDGTPLEAAQIVYANKKCQTLALAVPKHGATGWILHVKSSTVADFAQAMSVIYDAKAKVPGWFSPAEFERNKWDRMQTWKALNPNHERRKSKKNSESIFAMRGCCVGPV